MKYTVWSADTNASPEIITTSSPGSAAVVFAIKNHQKEDVIVTVLNKELKMTTVFHVIITIDGKCKKHTYTALQLRQRHSNEIDDLICAVFAETLSGGHDAKIAVYVEEGE